MITLAPVIGVVQTGTQRIADRYTYIPYIGLFIVVAWGAAGLLRGSRRETLVLAATAGGVLLALMVATWSQVGYWQNNITVFERALSVTEDNYMAHNNLGQALERRGEVTEAGHHYAEAVRIHPGYPPAQNNLGVALARRGDYQTAEGHFREALRIQPDFAVAQYNLGLSLEHQGDFPASIEHYSEAVRLKPDYFEAHFALADSLEYVGRIVDAARHYREVLRLRPNAGNARAGLDRVLAAMGQQDSIEGGREGGETQEDSRP